MLCIGQLFSILGAGKDYDIFQTETWVSVYVQLSANNFSKYFSVCHERIEDE